MTSGKRKILVGPLPPPYGGVAVFVSTLSREARERGFEVWHYTGESDLGPDVARSVNHRRLGHIWKLLRDGKGARVTDSTHFNLEYPHPLLLPLWLATKRVRRFRWIKVLHDGSLPERFVGFGRFRRRLFRMALRNIDEIAASCPALVDWLRDDLKYKGQLSTISTLVELPDRDHADPDPQLAERLKDLSTSDLLISSIGTFIPSYGFHIVADAVEEVRAKLGIDITLLLVDGAFADDPAYRRQVLQSRDWIEVIGSLPHDQVLNIFERSDIFVRPILYESVGLSRVEAIFAGVPVIATNIGETRGMVTFEPGDSEGLADRIKEVLSGNRPDTEYWSTVYRQEAEENRERYLQLITGDPE